MIQQRQTARYPAFAALLGVAFAALCASGANAQATPTEPPKAQTAPAAQAVGAAQLAGLVAGNSLDGAYPNGTRFQAYFDKSGQFIERVLGKAPAEDRGQWQIDSNGRFCQKFNSWYKGAAFCTGVVKSGEFLYEYTANNAVFRRWATKAGDAFGLAAALRAPAPKK